jgi:redox-sensitive bicupin YhaK (pirin superfamily)
MNDAAQARRYPASGRGLTDTGWFRSYNTFPFGAYSAPEKPTFGPLHLLNDETLGPEQNIRLTAERQTLLVLLPVTGAIDYRDSAGNDALLGAGEAGVFTLQPGTEYRVYNPYDAAMVHYLQLWIDFPEGTAIKETVRFDLEKEKNKLVEIRSVSTPKTFLCLYISRFDGRRKASCRLAASGHGVFAFVVQVLRSAAAPPGGG